MSFLLKQNWREFNSDLWDKLETIPSFKLDMYSDLLRYRISLRSKSEVGKTENVEILNDKYLSRETFLRLPTPRNEQSCLDIMAGYYNVLLDFPGKTQVSFRNIVADWVETHNLRYSVTKDLKFKLTIHGLLLSQTEFLKLHLKETNSLEALEELEKSVSKLNDPGDARNAIRVASNFLEGVVTDRAVRDGIFKLKKDGNKPSLNDLLDKFDTLFPHASIRKSVNDIYKFFCDYPNIRHSGQKRSKLRDLRIDDAILSVVLILGFTSFVIDNNSSGSVLRGNF